jgi:hypothetical protein
MGACEITLMSILLAILLVWFAKSMYQPSCAMHPAKAEDEPSAADMYPPTADDMTANNEKLAAVEADWPGMTAYSGAVRTTTLSPLEPFHDPSAEDLKGSSAVSERRVITGAFPSVFDASDSATHDMGDVVGMKTQRSRFATAMAAERSWQMQNALKTLNEKSKVNRNAIGSTVGAQALFEAYSGTTRPKPRAAPAGQYQLYMTEGSPESDALRDRAIGAVSTGAPGNL